VNAAGAWASQVEPRADGLPVRPVRGQMVLLAGPDQAFRHAIYAHDVYVVPRRDGRVLVGSTYEEVGFDKRVTADAVGRMLTRALRLAPALADATFREAWAGLRPGTPDRLPILGPDPRFAGLYHASGHYRSGILLAPATARSLAALILEGRSHDDLAPFSPARFAGL
jgi:glycine oxidase